MKYILLIALSLITQHIIAMDKPPVATQTNNTNAALDEIVTNIDKAINEKCLRSSLFEQFIVTDKKEENYCNILATPKALYPNITFNQNLLDKLYAKNDIFAQAIDLLVNYDLQIFENVTPGGLNTVNNFNAPQPIPLFNQLDLSVRKYILQRATNKIEHECIIKIAPGAPVIDFDICPTTDTLAISTGDKQIAYRLRLWDLKTANPLGTFEENSPVNYVCFNAPGNQLATLVVFAGKAKIKIWNPQSKQLLHTIEPHPDRIPHALIYNDHQTNYLLHTTNPWFCPETWITSTEQCLPCGFTITSMNAPQKNVVYRGNYRAVCPEKINILETGLIAAGLKALTVDVTKSNCSDLYLCEQATKRTQNKQSLNLITSSNPFKAATEYEKNIIRTSVEAKRKQLTS